MTHIRIDCILCSGTRFWEYRLCPCCGGDGSKLWPLSTISGPTMAGIDRLIADLDKVSERNNYYF